MTSTQTFWPHAQVLAGTCLLKPYRHILSTQRSPALTLNITKYYFVNNNSETLKKNQWPLINFELTQGLWSPSRHCLLPMSWPEGSVWREMSILAKMTVNSPNTKDPFHTLTPCVSLASLKKEFMILETRWIRSVLFEPKQSIQMYLEYWKALCNAFSKAFLQDACCASSPPTHTHNAITSTLEVQQFCLSVCSFISPFSRTSQYYWFRSIVYGDKEAEWKL